MAGEAGPPKDLDYNLSFYRRHSAQHLTAIDLGHWCFACAYAIADYQQSYDQSADAYAKCFTEELARLLNHVGWGEHADEIHWHRWRSSKKAIANFNRWGNRLTEEEKELLKLLAPNATETDSEEKIGQRLPDSPDVRDLCRELEKHAGRGKSQIQIAREFTGEPAGNSPKANSLMRQARRFRPLWDKRGQ